jgi:hypothetical protein
VVAAATCMTTLAKLDMQLRLRSWWASGENLAPMSVGANDDALWRGVAPLLGGIVEYPLRHTYWFFLPCCWRLSCFLSSASYLNLHNILWRVF